MDPRLSQGRWLRIPGPTPLHPDVVKALGHEMVPHRGPLVIEAMTRIQPIAKAIHGLSDGEVVLWAGTGTYGFEAAILNLTSPGDKVVVTVAGDFGDRFAKAGEMLGLDVRRVDAEWGEAVQPDELDAAIRDHGDVKAVMITHNETSTGVTQPLAELAAVARAHDALVVVDAVSSAAALPIQMDAWGLDWVLSGAQKAWMCPPGLMISAVSERAIAAAREEAGFPRMIFDLPTMVEMSRQHVHPTTGPLTAIFALDAATQAMEREGLDAVYARHRELGALVRSQFDKLGIEVLANPEVASNSVTAFVPPADMCAAAFRDAVRERSGVELAVGQGKLADRVNRLGHMGWTHQPELDATFEAIGSFVV